MTHRDDEIAKHIKAMILRITRRPPDDQEQPRKPDTVSQIVRILRRGPDYPYDLMPPTRNSWSDEGPTTSGTGGP
jgi:hypothetical protein